MREALRSEVPCIECSGALADAGEVPFVSVWLPGFEDAGHAPLVSAASGPALAWSSVLGPLDAHAKVRVVTGTALEGASAAGRGAIDSLYAESLALFNQEDPPEPEVIGQEDAED